MVLRDHSCVLRTKGTLEPRSKWSLYYWKTGNKQGTSKVKAKKGKKRMLKKIDNKERYKWSKYQGKDGT